MTNTATSSASTVDRLDFKKILPIFVIVFIDLLGVTIIIPLMSFYAASFSASPFVIGLLGAAYPAMQFVGAPLLGRLSDRYGRKPVLLLSQIGTLIGFLLLGFGQSLWVLFLARIIDGLSGANISTAQAVISDSTTAKNRTQGLGLIGAAFGLGFVIGPVIAFLSLAISGNNYSVPAFVAAGFSAISILLTAFLLKETLPPEKRGQGSSRPALTLPAMFRALGHPAVGLLLALMFGQQLAFGVFQQLLSLFTLNRLGLTASGNAIVFVFAGVVIVAMQGGFIGPLSRRLGERKLIYLGLGLVAAGMALMAFTPRQPLPGYSRQAAEAEVAGQRNLAGETPPTQSVPVELPAGDKTGLLGIGWLLVSMLPVSVGSAVLQPSINSLITKRVNSDEIGGMLGLSAAFLSGANALAPVLGGAAFQRLGAPSPFWLGALLLGTLLVVAWRFLRPGREEQAPAGLARGGGAH
jgi:MFS transporter, DHA1 family, tetracycline resistance protein